MVGVLAAVLLLGCGSDDGTSAETTDETTAPAPADLTGTSWVLESYAADADSVPAVAGAEATLQFADDGVLFGSTGCNRFTGSWTQDGDAVVLETGATTLVGCVDPEAAAQEQALLTLLPQAATVEQADDSLALLDADGSTLLTYTAGLADLAGTSWTATGINNQTGAVESSELTPTATAVFDEDGTVSGLTGCREFTGSWQTEGDTISVTDVTTEGDECTGDAATLEERYLAALEAASTFAIEGSTLNLRDSEGATQVNYSLATS